jgi:streptomycin 6-kinase
MNIPPALARNVVENWPEQGETWLAALPDLIAEVAEDWQLVLGPSFALSLHWVTAATRADGSSAVLKLGVPAEHLAFEVQALRLYDGHGAVRLLAEDLTRGALLLERAEPGTRVASLVRDHDEQATAVLVTVARRLHQRPPPGCSLPALRGLGEAFAAHLRRFPGDDPMPRHLVERAGRLFEELCDSAPAEVVLHGDLHHDNVLRADREPWLAIDPSGIIGDPGFECGAVLYNPDPWLHEDDLLALVPARIEQLADGLSLAVDRVVAWGFVMAVLSEVWTAKGGTPGTRALDVAALLLPLLG